MGAHTLGGLGRSLPQERVGLTRWGKGNPGRGAAVAKHCVGSGKTCQADPALLPPPPEDSGSGLMNTLLNGHKVSTLPPRTMAGVLRKVWRSLTPG